MRWANSWDNTRGGGRRTLDRTLLVQLTKASGCVFLSIHCAAGACLQFCVLLYLQPQLLQLVWWLRHRSRQVTIQTKKNGSSHWSTYYTSIRVCLQHPYLCCTIVPLIRLATALCVAPAAYQRTHSVAVSQCRIADAKTMPRAISVRWVIYFAYIITQRMMQFSRLEGSLCFR